MFGLQLSCLLGLFDVILGNLLLLLPFSEPPLLIDQNGIPIGIDNFLIDLGLDLLLLLVFELFLLLEFLCGLEEHLCFPLPLLLLLEPFDIPLLDLFDDDLVAPDDLLLFPLLLLLVVFDLLEALDLHHEILLLLLGLVVLPDLLLLLQLPVADGHGLGVGDHLVHLLDVLELLLAGLEGLFVDGLGLFELLPLELIGRD